MTELQSFFVFYLDSLPSEKTAQTSSVITHNKRKKKLNNAFIIYRSFVNKYKFMVKGLNQDKVSCHAATLWNSLDAESKQPFYQLSSEEKLRHALYGPVFVDVPKGRKVGSRTRTKKQIKKATLDASSSTPCSSNDSCASTQLSTSCSSSPQSLSSSLDIESTLGILRSPEVLAPIETIGTHCNVSCSVQIFSSSSAI